MENHFFKGHLINAQRALMFLEQWSTTLVESLLRWQSPHLFSRGLVFKSILGHLSFGGSKIAEISPEN